jgi:uncharacterized protein YprB with RNaseH-like and TPR domain
VLGGEWHEGCFVVNRVWEKSARHGREQVGALADQLAGAAPEASFFANGAPARPPFMFFDLETTGLSGGAGTQAFLVGCGWFESDRFLTRQFVLTRHADERPMLENVARQFAGAGALVSFNGKSFDATILETRYLFHRLKWFALDLPHVDVLHPARQFWRRDDCSLSSLERQLVGHRRVRDVSGFEIPGRYFQFVRTGDPGPLCVVLEHNRLDLLSLAALTSRLLHLACRGAESVRDAREAVALGHVYSRAGLDGRARDAYRKALALCRAPRGAFDTAKIDALRGLALASRRARCYKEAADCWKELLAIRGCPANIAYEANQALAIHNEHRLRDLTSARSFALLNLEAAEERMRPAWTAAVRHRLGRLDKKMKNESLRFEV